MNGNLFIERRKFKRVDFNYRITYKLIRGEEEVQEIKKAIMKKEGKTSDISLGGIKVYGEMDGGPGDIIRLEIHVDGRDEPITTFAEIKWIKQEKDKKIFGLEFLILKDKDRKTIEEIVGE
ncbi:MAG: PilZ domain-containing protein [Candidatus Goldbacteria bacterium]|nr:PilZ domain-containing protein [Candidatus Goldiibacteriota bacterium]